jgi:hypothetical protein
MKLFLLLLLGVLTAKAQLAVDVSPLKLVGQKAVVKLELKNGFAEKIESARAVCFVMDDQGKMVGQATKWVIGGDGASNGTGLVAGAKANYNFVISTAQTTTTNLTAKIQFSRVILEGGKSMDPTKSVQVISAY